MPLEDKASRRRVEHELSKFDLDTTRLSVSVINQVAYFVGRVRPIRGPGGRGVDSRKEMEAVAEAVLQLKDIKDVVLNCAFD